MNNGFFFFMTPVSTENIRSLLPYLARHPFLAARIVLILIMSLPFLLTYAVIFSIWIVEPVSCFRMERGGRVAAEMVNPHFPFLFYTSGHLRNAVPGSLIKMQRMGRCAVIMKLPIFHCQNSVVFNVQDLECWGKPPGSTPLWVKEHG